MPRPRTDTTTPPAGSRFDTTEDAAIVEACLSGDEAAWARLVERYGRLVYSIPRRYGLDAQSSEDVFQEVFAALARRLPRLENPRALPKWLMTTAWRVSRRMAARAAPSLDDPVVPADDEPPVEQAARWERQHLVHLALERLDERCRDLLKALFRPREDVQYDRIARELGMPRGSIGPTRARCLDKLGMHYRALQDAT